MCPEEGWKPGRPKFKTLDEALNRPDLSADEAKTMADRWYEAEIARYRESYSTCYRNYQTSIADGIAMEVARCQLPVAIYSSCWVTCNPRSLMSFVSLRVQDDAAKFMSYPQAETDETARAAEKFLAEGWPITYASFVKNGRVAP